MECNNCLGNGKPIQIAKMKKEKKLEKGKKIVNKKRRLSILNRFKTNDFKSLLSSCQKFRMSEIVA